jgi:Cu/Ag efflux protein CusF
MPPMTMVFSAKEAAQLEGLNKGDNVLFAVDQNMNITHIEKKQ